MQTSPSHPDRRGVAAALFCYLAWGLIPLLFQATGRAGASPWEIVAWRTVWSLPCAAALVWGTGAGRALAGVLRQPRTLAVLALSSLLIAVNWLLYVWAVDTHRTLSASLGYYINPLINMAAGALLFGERVDRTGWIAVALAGVGVVLQGIALGTFPWISLCLAISFGGYGIVRKRVAADALVGLLMECIILLLPALAYVGWLASRGQGSFGHGRDVTLLLLVCGPATVLPLAAFAIGARRLPLTLMGFLQFISPTLQFLVGLANGELLTPLRAVSFVFIWAGVLVFALAALQRSRGRTILDAVTEPV